MAPRSPFGMFRLAIGHVSRLVWACFALRKMVFRISIRHVSWYGMRMFERRKCCLSCKMLIDSALCGCAENRVFEPNIFLDQKKRVVFTIVCWHFLRVRVSLQMFPQLTQDENLVAS